MVISVSGKKWFQKSCGNTYHSAQVVIVADDGTQTELRTDYSYGYGNQWYWTAMELVNKHLKLSTTITDTPAWLRKHDIAVIDNGYTQVSRRKDL
jgi:hypothetical protein